MSAATPHGSPAPKTPAFKASKTGQFDEPPKTAISKIRHSYASIMSSGSYNPSEVGEAVSMPLSGQKSTEGNQVKQMYVNRTPGVEEDDESIFSKSLTQLGRLNTIKSAQSASVSPDIVVSTLIDSVIPPRLRRRPVSEHTPSPSRSEHLESNHRHRFSVAISDDLDKLMESASGLKEFTGPHPTSVATDDLSSRSRQALTHMSTDSFETAEEARSTSSSQGSTDPGLIVPKRPNAQNLDRARQASKTYAKGGEQENAGGMLRQPRSEGVGSETHSDTHSTSTWQDSSVLASELRTPTRKSTVDSVREIPKEPFEPTVFMKALEEDTGHSLLKSAHSDDLPPITPVDLTAGIQADDAVANANEAFTDNNEALTDKNDAFTHDNQSTADKVAAANETQPLASDSESELRLDLTAEIHSHHGIVSVVHSQSPILKKLGAYDDEFQDIEEDEKAEPLQEPENAWTEAEPVMVAHPARAKSVKDNTRLPRQKSKRKSRRIKSADSKGIQLKPFSYNTLVHLLESINGTVIGEEFETLNLPVQEKQLIEKIIDLLSRLTLDMVVDKNRYQVGIERLEKAHRVLEGFL